MSVWTFQMDFATQARPRMMQHLSSLSINGHIQLLLRLTCSNVSEHEIAHAGAPQTVLATLDMKDIQRGKLQYEQLLTCPIAIKDNVQKEALFCCL